MRRLLVIVVCGLAGGALADEAWETVQTDPIVVKARQRKGSDVKEFWAEGTVNAAPVDIESTLTDVRRFTKFMPYIVEARTIGAGDADGAQYVYSKMDLPWPLSPRDFVHKTYVDRDALKDAEGVFANHWFAVPNQIPRRSNVTRFEISEGSWLVAPKPGGGSHVTYHFSVDPSGFIPTGMANRSNLQGIVDTFKNVERESVRREQERLARKLEPANPGQPTAQGPTQGTAQGSGPQSNSVMSQP